MTRFIPLLLVLSLLALPTASAASDVVDYESGSVGTVVKVPAKDADVTAFTYQPKKEAIAKLAANEEALGSYLDALVEKGAFNTAAYIARYAPAKQDAFVMKWIERNIGDLTAPFYFVMSYKLDETDTKAAFQWYLRGFLASRVDATLCRDTSARQGVRYLNDLLGPKLRAKINEYAAADDLPKQQREALDYVRKHLTSASPMWICAHGISSFTDGNEGYKPVSERAGVLESIGAKFIDK